jgi:hypothetical protein
MRWEVTLRSPTVVCALKYLTPLIPAVPTDRDDDGNNYLQHALLIDMEDAKQFVSGVVSLAWFPLYSAIVQRETSPELWVTREQRVFLLLLETLLKHGVLNGEYRHQMLSGMMINNTNDYAMFKLLTVFANQNLLAFDRDLINFEQRSVATVPRLYHKDEVLLTRQLARKNKHIFTLTNLLSFGDLVRRQPDMEPDEFLTLCAYLLFRALLTLCFVKVRKFLLPDVVLQFDEYKSKPGKLQFHLREPMRAFIRDPSAVNRIVPSSSSVRVQVTPSTLEQTLFPTSSVLGTSATSDRFQAPLFLIFKKAVTIAPRVALIQRLHRVLQENQVAYLPRTTASRPFDAKHNHPFLQLCQLSDDVRIQVQSEAPSYELGARVSPHGQFSDDEKAAIRLLMASAATDKRADNPYYLERKRVRNDGSYSNLLQLILWRAYKVRGRLSKTYCPFLDVNSGLTRRNGDSYYFVRSKEKIVGWIKEVMKKTTTSSASPAVRYTDQCVLYEPQLQQHITRWHGTNNIHQLVDYFATRVINPALSSSSAMSAADDRPVIRSSLPVTPAVATVQDLNTRNEANALSEEEYGGGNEAAVPFEDNDRDSQSPVPRLMTIISNHAANANRTHDASRAPTGVRDASEYQSHHLYSQPLPLIRTSRFAKRTRQPNQPHLTRSVIQRTSAAADGSGTCQQPQGHVIDPPPPPSVVEMEASCQTDFDEHEHEDDNCSTRYEAEVKTPSDTNLCLDSVVAMEEARLAALGWPPDAAAQETLSWFLVPMFFAVVELEDDSIALLHARWGELWNQLVQKYRLSLRPDEIQLIRNEHQRHRYIEPRIQEQLLDRPNQDHAGDGLVIISHLAREAHQRARDRLGLRNICRCSLCCLG